MTSTNKSNEITLEEALVLAQRHHNAGNLMVAEQTYKDILNAVPDHAQTLVSLGVILHQQGKIDEALEYTKKATAADPEDYNAWGNYAVLLSEKGEHKKAKKAFRETLALRPDSDDVLSNYAHTLWFLKDYKESQKIAEKALKINPKNTNALLNLGNALQGQEKYEESIECWKKITQIDPQYFKAWNNVAYGLRLIGHVKESEEYSRKALDINENFPEAWNNYGNALYDQGKLTEAEEAFRQATNFKPDYVQAHNNLALTLMAQSRYAEASASARYAVTFDPQYADAYSTLSICAREQGDITAAEEYARKSIELSPDNPEMHLDLVDILLMTDRLDDAEKVVQDALALSPDTPNAYVKLANVKELMGDPDGALRYIVEGLEINPEYLELHLRRAQIHHINNELDKAMDAIVAAEKIAPESVTVLNTKSDIMQSLGRMDEAEKIVRAVIEKHPNLGGLYYTLSKFKKFEKDDPEFKKMKELEKISDKLGIFQACALYFGLFSAYNNTNQYKKAFESLKKANDLRRKLVPYNSRIADYQYQSIKEVYGKTFPASVKGKGYKSEIPVFIVGMPRSGTTLTEQIISSHPDVYGAGELPHLSRIIKDYEKATPENAAEIGKQYVEAVKKLDPSGKAERITDKMPGNFARMAEIIAALPDAKIIHCRRDPIDTCLSCYKQNFARGQYWSYDLEEMAAEYRRYADLMQHWRDILPEGSFIEIDYEDTVADLETQARKLIDYVGLEWDDACLSPHKNKRAVLTASKAQVIRPVYSSSVKAWKRYEKQLQPLIDGLGDLVPQKNKSAAKKTTKKKG